MARGMSMEEFRAGLSSEATKENEELKKQIKKTLNCTDEDYNIDMFMLFNMITVFEKTQVKCRVLFFFLQLKHYNS